MNPKLISKKIESVGRVMRRFRAATLLVFSLLVSVSVLSAQDRITDLEPTVILISIDGFRYDYIEKYSPPVISQLAANGTRAEWLIPSYPTKTFPNHYTVVTGLYPGSHGMVENNMYDAKIGQVFGISKPEQVRDPRWWSGEPIWNTVQKNGRPAASFFWPGSEAPIGGMVPMYWKKYDHQTPHEERVDTVLSWLDLGRAKRPVFISLYFSDVDDAGHSFGPESAENQAAIRKVDNSIGRLWEGLKVRGIEKKISIILVSDHGMAPYTVRNSIILDEMFDTNDAERIFWVSEFTQIFPKPGKEDDIYNSIKQKLPPTASIYRRNEMPDEWKLRSSARLAPLIVVPQPGTNLTTRQRFERAEREGTLDRTRGAHGYDNRVEPMRALFVGHGGRFRKGVVVDAFPNVDIYNVMCRILNVEPAKNDGDPLRYKKLLN